MRRVDGVVGNVDDDPELAEAVAAHERAGTLERVVLDDVERRRSRLRVTTEAGTELGVLVDRPELTAGDVLLVEDDRAVVVAFEPREAFVVEFPAAEAAVSTAVEFGHRVGNQHWDVAVDGDTVYVPVEADRAIIEDVLGPYLPSGATARYETVEAERFIEDADGSGAGGDSGGDHDHSHGGDHDHGHGEHSHGHGGGHGDGRDYSHGHGDDRDHSHDRQSASGGDE